MDGTLPMISKDRHTPRPPDQTGGPLRRFLSDSRAASIVEFGLVTPIFLAVLGASIDLGMAVRTKFVLSSAVTAASSYALKNAAKAESTDGSTLAQNLATLIASANGTNWANATVTVNNGPAATVISGTVTTSGTASAADSYYCPTGSGASITWGTGTSTAGTCTSSSTPGGKFIVLTASKSFTPMLLPSGIISSPITATSVVQVQ